MTKPRNNNKTKENNKSGKDTSGKRPASSSPAGNVSGQENTFSSPSGPVDTTSVEQTSQTDTSSLDASLHAPNNDGDKGKSIEKTPAVSFPERAVFPDASMAAVQSQPTKFYASAAPNAIEGFWNHFTTNHDACDVIIVHFHIKDDMEKATADSIDSLFGLHFHPYDPSAIKANENERTLVVTDIPLFLNDVLLRGTFSCFSNITKCHTKLAKLYRTAYVTFESTDAISKFDDTWAVLCGGLTWHSPNEVQSLCHRCGHSGCNPDQCGSSSSRPQRNPRPWQFNDKLRALYNKHLPPSHPAKRHNCFARPASDQRFRSRPNNSRTRSASKPPVKPRQPDHEVLDHYVDGMGFDQDSSYIPAINWTEISDALQAVVQKVAISSGSSVPYILTSIHGWDDPPASPNHNNNSSGKLIDVNSPPTASASGFTPIPQFSPLPSSVVTPNSPNDMEQRLSHLTNTVSNIMGSVQKGIEQQTQLLALRQGQSKN
ncbi:hypothetical protein C1646_773692 [Rhizophagus diaphanus]|nr:hypothetical protein C1646_773692 [Rhizophagus diaphanus] [Rhizophagus sp. MUCL 43196]